MQDFINIGLYVFYALIGFVMIIIAYNAFVTIDSNKKYGTALFWVLISLPFIFGDIIPKNIVGLILIICSVLTLTKQVTFGKYSEVSEEYQEEKSKIYQNKIFIPSLVLAAAAVVTATLLASYSASSQFAIGFGAIVALIFAMAMTKAKPKETVQDGAKLLQQMGPAALLPQLLVALGALFTAAGVGDVISELIGGVVPADSRLFGVIAYVLGMVIFTMIMGNAFAAFAVITAGIGVPFVLSQGGNPAIIGALALTAGYCGTLLTPMAANFNVVPAALLEMKDQNGVIKMQAPFALIMIVLHIVVMYFFGFSH